MGGLFDRLQNQLDNRDKDAGISPLDLAKLSPPLRKIMRMMLREVEMSYPELLAATQAMPEVDRLTAAELDQSLNQLSNDGWLIRLGIEDLITYKVNLRRKSGSSLAQGIWSALDSKLEKKPPEPKDSSEGAGTQEPGNS
jgi:hypothetical protein